MTKDDFVEMALKIQDICYQCRLCADCPFSSRDPDDDIYCDITYMWGRPCDWRLDREVVEKLIEENGLAQMADIEELSGFQRRRIWRFVDESDEYKRNRKGEVLRVDFSEKQEKSIT